MSFPSELLMSRMETTAPTTTEKKGSGLDGNGFTDLPKKLSPSAVTRGTVHFSSMTLKKGGKKPF